MNVKRVEAVAVVEIQTTMKLTPHTTCPATKCSTVAASAIYPQPAAKVKIAAA
jgi:hypothetical protein